MTPSLAGRCAVRVGRAAAGQARCWAKEISTMPGSSSTCPLLFCSCPWLFFTTNAQVCLRAGLILPVQAAPKGSTPVHQQLPQHHLLQHTAPACSSLSPLKNTFLRHIENGCFSSRLSQTLQGSIWQTKKRELGSLPIFINGWEEERTRPDSSPWCPVKETGSVFQTQQYPKYSKCHLNIRNLYVRVIDHWNRTPKKEKTLLILGDIPNPPGHDPGQPAPIYPPLSMDVGWDDLQRPLPTWNILLPEWNCITLKKNLKL